MLLSDGPGLQHSYNDPVRPVAARNDFKIYLKGLLTTLMQYVLKCVYLLLCVYLYVPVCNILLKNHGYFVQQLEKVADISICDFS